MPYLIYPTEQDAIERADEEGKESFEWGVAYEGSTHQVLTLPNLSQKEIKEILAAAAALSFDLEPVILAHDEVRVYKSTGELPLV